MDIKLSKAYLSNGKSLVKTVIGIILLLWGTWGIYNIVRWNNAGLQMGMDGFVKPTSFIGPILMLVVGIFFLVDPFRKKISDAEYDNNVKKGIGDTYYAALNKLGLDEDEVKEINPITISGYDIESSINIKKGKDGIIRSNLFKSVILFFTDKDLHCYSKTVNSLTGDVAESTDVYFYQDVVSIATETKNITAKGIKDGATAEMFRLTTSGGTSISVSIIDSDSVNRSILAMRSLLRERKQQ